jgi:SecD/SecF fusion protein
VSEYIPRLREELVAAAARERAGERRRLPRPRPKRLALVAATAALVLALVVAVAAIDLPRDEQPAFPNPSTQALDFQVTPVPGGDTAAAAQESAAILRARLAAAGVAGATVVVAGDRVSVEAPPAAHETVAALAVPGELAIYDWEASVLGPDGRPAPGDARVTGGQDAGRSGGVSQYEAGMRAAKAANAGEPAAYWLLDDGAREVIAGPSWSRDALGAAPDGARVVEVPGGVRIVEGTSGSEDRWFALAGSAAIRNDDVRGPGVETTSLGETGVAFELTPAGRTAFESLTRELARRGEAGSRPGEDPLRSAGHFAIVLDGDLASVPFVDYRFTPGGIDGRQGVIITGGLTRERARELAAVLSTGAMPAALVPDEEEAP